MGKNVSDQLLDILVSAGVKKVYGVIGDALNFFVKAIEERNEVEWIGMKHEGNGAFAAFGHSETSGTLGVCASTVGPGALHMINGLYNAKKERTPVLVITGQIPQRQRGTNYCQEVDLGKIFEDVCEYQAIIRTPEQATKVIQRAIQIAIAHRTVCRIELPADIAKMKAGGEEFIHPIFHSDATIVPGDASVLAAAEAIGNAKQIAILAGCGCRSAKEEVLTLSRKLKAPITHTLRAADIFDHETENVVGLTGLIGNPSGYLAVMKCDLLLMLGTDFPFIDYLPHHSKIIQVDIREENIGNRTAVDVGIHGDVKAFLQLLLPKISPKLDDRFLKKLRENFHKWRDQRKALASVSRQKEPLHPQIFADMINTHASSDAIFAIDTGTSTIWAAHYLSFHSDRRIMGSFNHGSMAVGFPAAIGAQFANPGKEVWVFSGDGAFNMSMQDFVTAVKYKLPIKILVFNNSQLSFVKLEMEESGLLPSLSALDQANVNFAEFAKLCGGDGARVEHAQDIESAVLQAKRSSLPFIIDAVVSSGELTLPPHIGFKEVSGFGTSKFKEISHALSGDKAQWENLKAELKAYFD